MQILQVDLVNVKSYVDARVSFAPGTNAIVGQNGAGKSTLLEAIGFALFDHLQVNQADFVREGEKTATVTVHVLGADERVYHVVRRCGGSSQFYAYDPQLDERLVEGKNDTLAWLRDLLGVEPDTDLNALFGDAVGVPQGLLTTAFLLRPGARKDIFNPLLRVDEYERAWSGLRETRSLLEKEIQTAETRIAGLTAELKALPERQAEVERFAQSIETGELQQETLAAEWMPLVQRRDALNAVKSRLHDLDRDVLAAESEARTLADRLEQAHEAVDRAEQAQVVVQESQAGHEAYMAALGAQESLEEDRRERDRLRSDLDQQARKLAAENARLATLAERLEAVVQAEADLASLRPQVEEQTRLEAALEVARRDMDRLATARRSLDQEQARLTRLRRRLVEIRAGLGEREGLEQEARQARKLLAPLDARMSELTAARAARAAELNALSNQRTLAEARLEQGVRDHQVAEAALHDLAQTLSALRAKLDERGKLEAEIALEHTALEKAAARQLDLAQQSASLETESEQVLKQLAVLEEVAVDSEGQPRCPICEGPLTREHYEDLLARDVQRLDELQVELSLVQRSQKSAERARRQRADELHAMQAALDALPRPAEVEELEELHTVQQRAVKDREEALQREQALVAEMQARQAELLADLADLQGQQSALQERREEKRQLLDTLQQRLAALPRQDEAERLAGDIDEQESAVEETARTVTGLAGAPEEVERLQGELASLGDPRGAARVAEATAGRRPEWEAQQSAAVAHRDALAAEAAALEQSLDAYEGLDARLSDVRQEVREHTPAHERYLRASAEAEALEPRRAEAAGLRDRHDAARAALGEKQSRRDAVARDFDPDELERVVTRADELQAQLATLEGRLDEQRDRHDKAQAEVERLEAVGRELEAARLAQTELHDLRALLDSLRTVVRDAGPRITAALVGLISHGADLIYSEIIHAGAGQNPGARLHWTDDYDIVLRTRGQERSFQQLSGGEQMAAALAVRLALLRQISTVDVAFFDEPTANLDRERRSNLAAQILSVKGFSQLFVISHDDTFEQDTDHVVHIVKEDGQSRVAALVAD